MQTLAVVTMAFLPATFLATIFAMPILQWEQGMGAVMRPELGLYFGLCVPVTLGIFGAWAWLTHRRKLDAERKQSQSKEKLMRQLRRKRENYRPDPLVRRTRLALQQQQKSGDRELRFGQVV